MYSSPGSDYAVDNDVIIYPPEPITPLPTPVPQREPVVRPVPQPIRIRPVPLPDPKSKAGARDEATTTVAPTSRWPLRSLMSTQHRVQLDFSSEAFKELEEIQKLAGVATRAAAIRNALSVYKWFLETTKGDNEILVRSAKGEVEKIRFVGG